MKYNVSGIYGILNRKNNKIYIGQSVNVKKRLENHKSQLVHNKHFNNHLQNSVNKYGINSFEFILLKHCKIQYLNRFEKLFIKKYKSANPMYGYNLEDGGTVNHKVSDETKRKISKANSGENHPLFGKHQSIETRKKLSESHKQIGKNHNGELNPFYGKNHSEETKKKLSDVRKGKSLPNSTIKKMSMNTTTGFFRVSKITAKCTVQGFTWKYSMCVMGNNSKKQITCITLDGLKEKVLRAGLEWCVVDENRARNTCKLAGLVYEEMA